MHSNIESHMNWEKFEEQREKDKRLQSFKGLSRSEVLKKLEDKSLTTRLEPLLKEQRKGEVVLKGLLEVKDTMQFMISEFNRFSDSLNKHFRKHSIWSIETQIFYSMTRRIQYYIYQRIAKGEWSMEVFEEINLRLSEGYKKFHIDRYHYYVSLSNANPQNEGLSDHLFEYIKKLKAYDIYDNVMHFNYLNYIVNKGYKKFKRYISFKKLSEEIDKLELKLSKEQRDAFKVLRHNFNVIGAHYYHFEGRNYDHDKMRHYLELMYSYYVKKQMSDDKVLSLAKFFTYSEQDDLAYNTLVPYVSNRETSVYIFQLFSKLSFKHMDESKKAIEYITWLKRVRGLMTKEEWCSMFVGPCYISFQVMDYKPFRDFYCKECNDYLNYAKDPSQWKKH